VFDGRGVDFDINDCLPNLSDTLPAYDGEISQRSFALVAYTASSYKSSMNRGRNFSANLQWVVVIGNSPNN